MNEPHCPPVSPDLAYDKRILKNKVRFQKPKPIDMTKLDMSNPDNIMKMSKSGKPTMMFVSVSGNPTEKEATDITQIWQSSLFNANMDVQRYMVESNRAIFMVRYFRKTYID